MRSTRALPNVIRSSALPPTNTQDEDVVIQFVKLCPIVKWFVLCAICVCVCVSSLGLEMYAIKFDLGAAVVCVHTFSTVNVNGHRSIRQSISGKRAPSV